MIRKAIGVLALPLLLSIAAAGQMQEEYLDVQILKVKPEKRAAFDAVAKKVADANRQHKGDTWVALETTYGELNTVYFVSVRRNYADIDKGIEAFMGALTKAYGPDGAMKILQEVNNDYVLSSRAEVRRRRWDLSTNVPEDPAARNKLVGEARWVRSTIVHVRPGQRLKFEEQLRTIKAAEEKATPPLTSFVSQADVGQEGNIYYFSSFRSSLAGFDTVSQLPQLLGEEGYKAFLKTVSETVLSMEFTLNRILPELSNPPEQIASVAPDFWNPKPAAAKPKPKAAEGGKAKANEKK